MGWTNNEMPWLEESFPKIIVEKVSLLSLLDYYKIDYMPCSSGNFDHKMKCPLPMHSEGSERTASCFVSSTTNKFYCYGCNRGSSVIDFVSFYSGKPYIETLKWLAQFAGITSIEASPAAVIKEKKDPNKTTRKWIMDTGIIIRTFLKSVEEKTEYNKWCDWAEKRYVELDKYMDELKDKDYEIVEKYYNKVKKYLGAK
ncbi:MAG: CHC2 zinc finger domain-containing protein [Patescibacteria group bacterium]